MKLMGWILVFASLLGAIWLGSSLLAFIDFPSMLLILGVSSGVVLSRHSLPSIRIGIRAIAHRPTDVGEQQTAAAALGSARSGILGAAAAGFLIGIVQILQNMADPSAIGPAMAVALLTAFYAVVLSELIIAPTLSALSIESNGGSSLPSALNVLVAVLVSGTTLMGGVWAMFT